MKYGVSVSYEKNVHLCGSVKWTGQCGDTCGTGSSITNQDTQIGRLTTLQFQTDGDLIIDYDNDEDGCHQVRQAYFLYRLAQV